MIGVVARDLAHLVTILPARLRCSLRVEVPFPEVVLAASPETTQPASNTSCPPLEARAARSRVAGRRGRLSQHGEILRLPIGAKQNATCLVHTGRPAMIDHLLPHRLGQEESESPVLGPELARARCYDGASTARNVGAKACSPRSSTVRASKVGRDAHWFIHATAAAANSQI